MALESASPERVRLEATRWFFPLLLVPIIKGTLSRGMIGIRNGSPIYVKDIKASQSQCRLELTDKALRCNKLIPRWLLIEIQLSDIASVRLHPQLDDLLEVRFRQAKKGRLLRFLMFGNPGAVPQDVVYFNLGDEAGRWLEAVRDSLQIKT
jgi:hypothetical protein